MDSMLNQAPENKCRSLGWQCNVYWCYNTLYKTDASPSGLNLFRYSQANRAKIRWSQSWRTKVLPFLLRGEMVAFLAGRPVVFVLDG